VIYLDTSALVKLVRVEPESTDLADWLDDRTELRWITSTLAEVELPRALIRAGHPTALAAVPAVLARLDRFEVDPALRSLDAIHLATAAVAASVATLAAFVTYDSRLSDAAFGLKMPTAAPGTT
jgi:uncharacterized protein